MKSIIFALTLATVLILPVGTAGAATNYEYRVLHNFTGTAVGCVQFCPSDGVPNGNLIMDSAGNLYGTTQGGTVFKVTPNPDGTWTETVIQTPLGPPTTGLILDKAGNLYGTMFFGGGYNCGAVFKLTPNPDGTWTETILYNFPITGPEGAQPGGIIFDAAGNLYGTTWDGGTLIDGFFEGGTAFKLTPNPVGFWNETVMHDFCSNGSLTNGRLDCPDGDGPQGNLVSDEAGNFYGATLGGGVHGAVFKLAPNPNGTWTESVLDNFGLGADGGDPLGGVIFDRAGNLYGTTTLGGDVNICLPIGGCGVFFQLKPQADGTWTEQVLHVFQGSDGFDPTGSLLQGTDGNFYGTTEGNYTGQGACGGTGCGTIFMITPTGTLTTLYNFNGPDGAHPSGGLLQAPDGTLYGTTAGGGNGLGTVFSLSVGFGPFLETLPASGSVGAKVVIIGNGLAAATGVSFNGVPAAFQVISSTEITATVPPGATTGIVQVRKPHSTLQSNVAFRVTPQITFEPLSGPNGTVVTINGVGLSKTTAVSIAGVNATNFTVDSDTQVTATVISANTTGPVVIVTPSVTMVSATNFTVSAATWTLKNTLPITEYSSARRHSCAPMNVTAGDLLLSYNIVYYNASTSSPTLTNSDTQGNTWTAAETVTIPNFQATILQIQYARAKSSGIDTIMVSAPNNVENIGNGCEEWSGGAASGSILDFSGGAQSSTTSTAAIASPATTGFASTTGFNRLVVAFCAFPWDSGYSRFAMGAGAGYTQGVFNKFLQATSVFQAGAGMGSQTASCTTSGPASNWAAIIAAFVSGSGT